MVREFSADVKDIKAVGKRVNHMKFLVSKVIQEE